MKDLRARLEAEGLNKTLARSGLTDGGRVVMFMSVRKGEGASSIAASSALIAARNVQRPAWLVDLDVAGNRLFDEFAHGAMSKAFGGVGRPYSACLRQKPFFSIEPNGDKADIDPASFTAHQVGDTRLMVTRFDTARLESQQTLRIKSRPAYWAAVRKATDWTVVDAPALEVSTAGLAVAAQMDNCVIVARADATPADEIDNLRRQILEHGGKVTGVVLNNVGGDALFMERLSGVTRG